MPDVPSALATQLELLYRSADLRRYRERDPVAYVHRYHDPADQQVMAVFASALAFGRVELFGAVLEALTARFDAHGGPAAWVDQLDRARAAELDDLYYRWCRGPDLALLGAALRRAQRSGSLEASLLPDETAPNLRARAGLSALRAQLPAAARDLRLPHPDSRGARFLLPDPGGSSALKRWSLMLRWLVRPTTEGVDLGLWTALTPAELIIPVDTHVSRIARLIGLTTRSDTTWRAAETITEALRAIDPVDPLRFDFALAHAGISDRCRGRWWPEACMPCALRPVCSGPSTAR